MIDPDSSEAFTPISLLRPMRQIDGAVVSADQNDAHAGLEPFLAFLELNRRRGEHVGFDHLALSPEHRDPRQRDGQIEDAGCIAILDPPRAGSGRWLISATSLRL